MVVVEEESDRKEGREKRGWHAAHLEVEGDLLKLAEALKHREETSSESSVACSALSSFTSDGSGASLRSYKL